MAHYFSDGSPLRVDSASETEPVRWMRGLISDATGKVSEDPTYYMTRIFSEVIEAKSGLTITCESDFKISILSYAALDSSAFSHTATNWSGSATINEDSYIVIAMKKNSGQINPEDGQKVVFDGNYELVTTPDKPKSLGGAARLAKLLQLGDIVFKAPSGYPLTNGDTTNEETFVGIPYSTVERSEGFVGSDISLYSYLSAVRNQNSVIYTRKFNDILSRCYYGLDCSAYVCGCMGVRETVTTRNMWNWDKLTEITDRSDIQLMDFLLKSGHVAIVTGIHRDKYGRIVMVDVYESRSPRFKHNHLFWTDFINFLNGTNYHIFRYADTDDSMFNSPLEYIFPDDLATIEKFNHFSDITTEYGSEVLLKAGTNVAIQIVGSGSYSGIQIYKDGSLQESRSAAGFTMSNISNGKYEIRLTGSAEIPLKFNVASGTLTTDGNDAVFTTDGCSPFCLTSYRKDPINSEGNLTDYIDPMYIHFLTAEEIENGRASVATLINYARSQQGYLKLLCYDEYGQIFIRHDVV